LAAEQRIALVTGANRGIGLEIAKELAKRGLRVVLGARQIDSAGEAADRLKAEGLDVFPQALDVTHPASIEMAVREIEASQRRIDVLVNNAAVFIDGKASASRVAIDAVQKTLDANLLGAWRMSQAVLPMMRHNRYGRIVNVTSGMGSLQDLRESGGSSPAYRLSKTALNALTLLLASELRDENILVNAACPGWVRTDMGGSGAPRSVEQGADTPVWLATLPDGGPSGQLFHDRQPLDW
jgi:NAD(P)-dependent dehydrogenase (short-subunit alcohol dehydrogenase family)